MLRSASGSLFRLARLSHKKPTFSDLKSSGPAFATPFQSRACTSAASVTSPSSVPVGKFEQSSKLALGFTCKPCGQRVNRFISRSSYTKGVVLVRCPGCQNVHLIADHLGWFKDLAPGAKTIEDIAASKGELVRKQLEEDEVFEDESEMELCSSQEKKWELAPDKTFRKCVLTKGSGLKCPRDGSICGVRIVTVGQTSAELLATRSKMISLNQPTIVHEICIGESDTEFDDLLEKVLEHMKPGEKSLCAFQIHEQERTGVLPQNSSSEVISVELEVDLLSFTEVPELWELQPDQLVANAQHHKDRAVDWYKSGHLLYALKRFARAMRSLLVIDREVLENLAKDNDDARALLEVYRNLLCTLHTNVAAIQLRSGNFKSVIENCTKALRYDPASVKAKFRRGTAYSRTGQIDLARKDLLDALKDAPKDTHIRNEIRLLDATVSQL